MPLSIGEVFFLLYQSSDWLGTHLSSLLGPHSHYQTLFPNTVLSTSPLFTVLLQSPFSLHRQMKCNAQILSEIMFPLSELISSTQVSQKLGKQDFKICFSRPHGTPHSSLSSFLQLGYNTNSSVAASFSSKGSSMSKGNAACNFHMRTIQTLGDW